MIEIPLTKDRPLPRAILFFLLFWAFFIQTQINFGRNAASLGLTLNLGDFFLPGLGIIILWSLIKGTSQWPRWSGPKTDLFIAGLTGLCIFSLLWGWHLHGTLSPWALVNRLTGWGVLIAYFYAGGWLCSTYGPALQKHFMNLLFWMTGTIGLVSLFSCLLWDLQVRPFSFMPSYPLAGFMWNRNAFAFLYMATITSGIILILSSQKQTWPVRLAFSAIIATIPLILFYNGSRIFIYTMPLLLLGLAIVKRRRFFQLCLIPLLFGLTLPFLIEHVIDKPLLREQQSKRMVQILTQETIDGKFIHTSDNVRALLYSDALHWWTDHPILGLGLGGFLEHQKHVYGKLIDLVDSVPLWLLSEMGGIGLIAFAGFGLYLIRPLIQQILNKPRIEYEETQVLSYAMVSILLIFIIMGIFHQIFYARFLWLLLGMTAALPRATSSHSIEKPLP